MIYKIYREQDPITRKRQIVADEVEFTGVSIIFWNFIAGTGRISGTLKKELVARFPETDYLVFPKKETEPDDA